MKIYYLKTNIIAISGDSGSGKSTLLEHITKLFNNNFIKLETDRYHKWERDDENYFQYTHLNPISNNLDKMNSDIYSLKLGNDIYVVDYDHKTGKFTQEEKIEYKDNIILCGLHTLYNNNTNNLIDIKIFMDTDRELIKKWKIKRDVEQRGYNIDKVLNQIKSREKDYNKYIKVQKNHADIIIQFYEVNMELKCKIIILNQTFNKKIVLNNSLLKNYFKDNNIIFKLDNNFYDNIIYIIKCIIN